MAEVLFNNIFLLCFLFFLQLETFFFLCYNNVIYLLKTLKITKVKNNIFLSNLNLVNSLYFFLFFILLYSFKFNFSKFGQIFMFVVIYLWQLSIFSKKMTVIREGNTIELILPSFLIILLLLCCVDSFLSLFFFIELYGVLYYFFFLTSYNFTNQNILRYKNGLLLLLWNNFLTTIFLTLGCFFMLHKSGSTNFFELYVLDISCLGTYLYLFGFFWKLGLPLFHFFKLEVYNFLLKDNIFFFSLLTTLINITLLYILFTQPIIFQTLQYSSFIVFFLMFSIVLVLTNLKVYSFLKFFAFSGIFTVTTVITLFLI